MKQPLVRSLKHNFGASRSKDLLESTTRSLAVPRAVPGTHEIGTQPLAAAAHPTDTPRRYAHHQCKVANILCHHRSGGHEGIGSDRMAAEDRGVGPDRCAASDDGTFEFSSARNERTGINHICEDTARAAEHILFENDAFVDADVVLDFAPVADFHPRTDHHVLADR